MSKIIRPYYDWYKDETTEKQLTNEDKFRYIINEGTPYLMYSFSNSLNSGLDFDRLNYHMESQGYSTKYFETKGGLSKYKLSYTNQESWVMLTVMNKQIRDYYPLNKSEIALFKINAFWNKRSYVSFNIEDLFVQYEENDS